MFTTQPQTYKVLRLLGTLGTAALVLILTVTVQAKPRRQAPAPLALTQTETLCRWGGQAMRWVVERRDQGVLLTNLISTMRLQIPLRLAHLPEADRSQVTEIFISIAPTIYAHPELTPWKVQYDFEIGCLTTPETSPTTFGRSLWR